MNILVDPTIDMAPKIIICFYASTHKGSEYRSGLDYIRIAGKLGFDYAIISDLSDNLPEGYSAELGLHVVRVEKGSKSQDDLYAKGDYSAAKDWLKKVLSYIQSSIGNPSIVWICNPAQPWLPIQNFFSLTQLLIWGPVGGGESILGTNIKLTIKAYLFELLRNLMQHSGLLSMKLLCSSSDKSKMLTFSRTLASKGLLNKYGIASSLIPEIPTPIVTTNLKKNQSKSPVFLWVGRNVPRKNLLGAIHCFLNFLQPRFPSSRLEIYGIAKSKSLPKEQSIVYHGWVDSIPFQKYKDSGVLLFSSRREGLPSSVIEAIENGLLVVAGEVGALPFLMKQPNYLQISHDYYSSSRASHICDDNTVIERVWQHMSTESITLQTIDYTNLVMHDILAKSPLRPDRN